MSMQKVWRKAKAQETTFNPGAYTAAKPSTALPKGMRKGVLGKYERYTPRTRPPGEVLPPTHVGTGEYHPGDGETPVFYRPGAFDHMKYKSLRIGA